VNRIVPKITGKRIELKDRFDSFDLPKIQKAIQISYFAFRKPFPDRQINSIYLDDYSYSSLEESFEGNSLRTKTRIRWYDFPQTQVSAVLELKKKQGVYSWKHLYENCYQIDPKAIKWSSFINFLDKERINIIKPNFAPKSLVSYTRSYYASFDGKVRITIDRNLKTYQQTNSSRPNITFHREHLNTVVLEIKVHAKDSHLVREVCKDIPFNAQRFSKYCESLMPRNNS